MVRLGGLPKYMHQATAVHLAKEVAHQITILQVNQGTLSGCSKLLVRRAVQYQLAQRSIFDYPVYSSLIASVIVTV